MSTHVLLIEDNEINCYRAPYLLQAAGCDVMHGVDGLQGILLVRKTQPALILLGIKLPKMNGYAVARALKAEPACAAIPIVAVTSHTMVGDREAALAAVCIGYIEKPIDADTFAVRALQHAAARGQGPVS